MLKNTPILATVMLFAILGSAGCSSKAEKVPTEKWEYKILSVEASGSGVRTGKGGGSVSIVLPSTDEFNRLGAQGSELSNSYLEMETAWVNFGDTNYVAGLQPNVRPQSVVFIFKRKVLQTVK